MKRPKLQHKNHAWSVEQVLANQRTIQRTEVWVAGRQGGNDMNGRRSVGGITMPSTNETESPVAESSSQKQPDEPQTATSSECVKCLVCGLKVEADAFVLPLLIIEDDGSNGVGFRAVIHQSCFYDYDERLISEDVVEVIEI